MMKVNINQAVKYFFSSSSLEMVYFEAVANAIDADATDIKINIAIESKNSPKTLKITIEDNGVGFTDERYKKFSNLFDVDDVQHKGLGRLVYLFYFDKV
ncbi:MAG: sensor histidine kinase, partial [Epsilonproteobacteria bacterium]|nr:sensor histidine kinase [Campylobacterota bacterium]